MSRGTLDLLHFYALQFPRHLAREFCQALKNSCRVLLQFNPQGMPRIPSGLMVPPFLWSFNHEQSN